MLPKIRLKMFLTPELTPTFSANEDDLRETLGIITSVLDGNGYVNHSGARVVEDILESTCLYGSVQLLTYHTGCTIY